MPELNSPYWQGYAGLLQHLGLGTAKPDRLPAVAGLNSLLDQYVLPKAGKSIRFVPAQHLPAVAYEEHIYRTGEISTREDNWHDLFNALVWARFPCIKAALNDRHFAEIQRGNVTTRGKVRDAITLFDECGVVVIGDREESLWALAERTWQQLFCQDRSDWQQHLRVFVMGHALLEKFLSPYKSLTAQVMVFRDVSGFLQKEDEWQTEQLDQILASQIQAGDRLRSSSELSPLPLMGIPGWWLAEPQDDGFYADEQVFRPPPTGFSPAKIDPLEIDA